MRVEHVGDLAGHALHLFLGLKVACSRCPEEPAKGFPRKWPLFHCAGQTNPAWVLNHSIPPVPTAIFGLEPVNPVSQRPACCFPRFGLFFRRQVTKASHLNLRVLLRLFASKLSDKPSWKQSSPLAQCRPLRRGLTRQHNLQDFMAAIQHQFRVAGTGSKELHESDAAWFLIGLGPLTNVPHFFKWIHAI